MDINLELYKVFYYVATTLSFSEASRQLFISQSAHALYPQYKKSPPHAGRRTSSGARQARPSDA